MTTEIKPIKVDEAYSVYARLKDSAMPWLFVGAGSASQALTLVHKYQELNKNKPFEILTMLYENFSS